jgi:hypothetical protein
MNRSIVFRIIMVFILIGAIIGLGIFAYQLGLHRGIAVDAQLPEGEAGQVVVPYGWMHYGYPYLGFGFLTCLVPIFLLFVVFCAIRLIFGHNHWGWRTHRFGYWGMNHMPSKEGWEKDVPPVFSEWHRKVHEPKENGTPDKPA